MTISSTTNKVQYVGNGTLTTYIYPFKIFEDSDLVVITTVDGVDTTETNYTVTGASSDTGGTIVFDTAPLDGTTITIKRVVPVTQETDYVENDPFPAEAHEDALDKLTMIDQQQDEDIDRSLKYPISDPLIGSDLPSQDDRATFLLGFDDDGAPRVSTSTVDEVDAAVAAAREEGTIISSDSFTGNGVTVDYDISVTPVNKFALLIQIGGATQEPSAYDLSGNTVTFTEAPGDGVPFTIRNLGYQVGIITGSASTTNYVQDGGTVRTVQNRLRTTKYLSDYADFTTALSVISTDETLLVIDEAFTLTANATVLATTALEWRAGSLASGAFILTINGSFNVGRYKVFNAGVTVAFGDGSISEMFPEWWGARADGVTESGAAIQLMMSAAESMTMLSGPMCFAEGTYLCSTNLSTTGEPVMYGNGKGSILNFTANGGIAMDLNTTTSDGSSIVAQELRNLTIYADKGDVVGTHPDVGVKFVNDGGTVAGFKMDLCNIYNFNTPTVGKGLWLNEAVQPIITRSNISFNWDNIVLHRENDSGTTAVLISGCNIRRAANNGITALGGIGISISNKTVIESNQANGFYSYMTQANAGPVSVSITDSFFENNGINQSDATTQYYDIFFGGDIGTLFNSSIKRNFFTSGAPQTAAHIYYDGDISNWYADITDNNGAGTLSGKTQASDIAFVDGGGGSDTITSTAIDFSTLISPFTYFQIIGSGSNDGIYYATAVAANTITVATGTLATEGAGAEIVISALEIVLPIGGFSVLPSIYRNTLSAPPYGTENVLSVNGLNLTPTKNVGLSEAGNMQLGAATFSNALVADGSTWHTIARLRNSVATMGGLIFIFGLQSGFTKDFLDVVPITWGTLTPIAMNSRRLSGIGSIPNGSTSVVIAHNLEVIPPIGDITITTAADTTNDIGNVWVDSVGAANMTVNVSNDPGAGGYSFAWSALTKEMFGETGTLTRTYRMLDNNKLQVKFSDPGGSPDIRLRAIEFADSVEQ